MDRMRRAADIAFFARGLPSRVIASVRLVIAEVHAGQGPQLRELASLYDTGHLRPLIDKTFPFDQTLGAGIRRAGPRQRQGRYHARLTTPLAAQRLQWVR
jgi:NADPH:quinone reductase-like Zn-dependent oxidoreductase